VTEFEKIPAGEEAAIDEILRLTMEQLKKESPPGTRPVKRDAHAKHHGLVRAELTVHEALPPELAVGVFQTPRTYRAYVRFSNSVGNIGDDHEPQTRGMAVKLLGVPGEKLLPDERHATTQDFVLLNNPEFPVADLDEYIRFMKAVFSGSPIWFFLPSLNPFRWRIRELLIVMAMRNRKVSSPLTTQYYSATPYLLGDRPIQFSLRPTSMAREPIPDSPDYLREAMRGTLAQGDASFEFLVRFRASEDEPIEDPRIPWKGQWRSVATLRIPRQTFLSPAQLELAENISFTSWHSLPEHRPLGSINRARKRIYQAISQYRHRENGVPIGEPTGDETFE